jgi:hypothetical protein
VVTQGLQLVQRAAFGSVGVESVEVVAARVSVGGGCGAMCEIAVSMECWIATLAFWGPRREAIRR